MSTLWSLLCDWRLFLEVALLFFVIYTVFYFLRNTQGSLVMEGFLLLTLLLNAVARLLNLEIIADILELLSGSLLLFILILLQPELRRGMAHLGNLLTFETRRRRDTIDEIVHAVENMAKRKCGALIVIECKMRLQPLIDDAIQLDSKVNSQLLESIFFPNSPLHDGAVIIRGSTGDPAADPHRKLFAAGWHPSPGGTGYCRGERLRDAAGFRRKRQHQHCSCR